METNIELNAELVDKINELIGVERNLLNKDNSNELITKLKNKISNLKDNFIANLPYKYTNDESEFLKFCSKIQNLRLKLDSIKSDDRIVKNLIDEYKLENLNETSLYYEAEFKPLVLKAISIKRQLFYIQTLKKLEEFQTKIESFLKQYNIIKENYKVKLKNLPSNHQNELNALNKSTFNEINVLLDKIVFLYLDLVDYSNNLAESKCENLKSYIKNLVSYLHESIQNILINEFESNLNNISYPISTSYSSPTETSINQNQVENLDKDKLEILLQASAKRLLMIQQPSLFLNNAHINDKNLIIYLLIKPLQKRFKFHFFTNRKTNNLDKPEWYLSQILQWVKDQHDFINRVIQKVFDDIDYLKEESAIILFSNSLVCLIREKLEFDLNNLIKNQVQFSHTIDELILFNSQLKTYLKSTELALNIKNSQIYTCLHFICENSVLFSHWLNLERQICQKKLDFMFSSLSFSNLSPNDDSKITFNLSKLNNEKLINEIWSCNYSDVDSMKPPNCAESFILMIKAITDRYSNLPYPSKKLRFVNLQLELINDFHLRLCQIIRDEAKTPFSKSYLGVLNTINYIIYILDEWKNSPFFIEMQYYKLKYLQFLKKITGTADSESNGSKNLLLPDNSSQSCQTEFDEDICKLFDQSTINNEKQKANQLSTFFDMEGNLFDDTIPSYEKIKDDMISTISSNCKREIISRSKLYKKEKWMTMPLFSEYYKPTLTQSATDMLISLRNMLHLLQDSIAKSVFESILKKITFELDKFFYEDLIINSQFNEGGISQLDYDINKYLMPILNEFAFDIKIENYFRLTKESVLLLKLKLGSALLLKDVLNKALINELSFEYNNPELENNKKLAVYNAKNALKEFGIVQLTCEQARDIICLNRTDINELK